MTEESLLAFIYRRMYEIEASGASEQLTGQIVAFAEIKQKVLEVKNALETDVYGQHCKTCTACDDAQDFYKQVMDAIGVPNPQ